MFRGAQTASNWTCRSHLYMPRADVRGRQLLVADSTGQRNDLIERGSPARVRAQR